MTIASLSAQDMTSVFLSTPENMLFGINAEGKDKLIAAPNDSSIVEVDSELNGKVKRLKISDDYISLQTSDAGTLQIKLLPLVNESKIICLVKTVCGKACDSQINFYSTNWVPLENVSNLIPKINSDLFIKADTDRTDENFINAFAAIDMIPIKMDFDTKDTSLKVTLDIENYLSKSDFDKISTYLIDSPLIFHWDKTSFK